jgi:hypothetical protein
MSFHLWKINELYSNADGTIQFVEMADAFAGENFVGGQTLVATGTGSPHTFTFPGNLSSSQTANTKLLLATTGFLQLGIVVPDFVISSGFLFTPGGTLNYGSGLDVVTYSQLPTDGALSINRTGTQAAASPTSFTGATSAYALHVGSAIDDTLIGGTGQDFLFGGAGTDTLTGGTNSDKFSFSAATLSDAQLATPIVDTVKDFDRGGGLYSVGEGDQIDVSAITATASVGGQPVTALVRVVDDPTNAEVLLQVDSNGTTGGIAWTTLAHLTGLHGGDNVNVVVGTLKTGTLLSVLSNEGHFGDFDGDHQADVVWRNDNGAVAVWKMNSGAVSAGNFFPGVPNTWHIMGTGDFSGDGKSDILWLNDDGSLIYWQMNSSSQLGLTPSLGTAPANSYLAGIGDVDHDNKADLFWRDNGTGAITVKTMAGATGTTTGVGNDWSVVGVADYNGDGVADVMFRNASLGVNAAWLMNGTARSSTVFYSGVPNDWHVETTGDFNGDGRADLFWHNDSGGNAVWLLNAQGAVQNSVFFSGVTSDWHVVGAGDFNNDAKDDILWRNDAGATSVWTMQGVSAPVVSFPGGVPQDWATQAHHYDYV